MNKMLDLCKLLGVEEGEEFGIKLFGVIDKYRLKNGKLEYYDGFINKWVESTISMNDILESEIIKLPKKKEFSQDTLNFFKCIDKKFEWIAKDKDGEVCIYINKPKKEDVSWVNFGSYKPLDIIKNSLFTEIKWEDEEPIYIDDYVDRK